MNVAKLNDQYTSTSILVYILATASSAFHDVVIFDELHPTAIINRIRLMHIIFFMFNYFNYTSGNRYFFEITTVFHCIRQAIIVTQLKRLCRILFNLVWQTCAKVKKLQEQVLSIAGVYFR